MASLLLAGKVRKAAEAERQNTLNYQAVQHRIQEIARAREEARRRRQEAKRKAAVNPLQALWDANGAAIYEANQGFKQKYGKNMSASVRKKAIKDATVNGHFNAGAYAGNLVKAATPPPPPNPYAGAADRIRAAANEIEDEKKIGYQDAPLPKKPSYVVPDMSWKGDDMREAEDYQKNKELQEGLRAYYEGRKAGEDGKYQGDVLADYMEAQQWRDEHALEALEYGHKSWTPDKREIKSEKFNFKEYLRESIPAWAESAHNNIYLPIATFAEARPKLANFAVNTINLSASIGKIAANLITDGDPNTMSWTDLGRTWLYELGDSDTINFGPDSKITQDVMTLSGVQGLREDAILKIQEGRLENDIQEPCINPDTPPGQYPVCRSPEYGTARYYASLGRAVFKGNAAELFLGSYFINIDVEPLGDNKYVFNYEVENTSTWESATRFRDDIDQDHSHDPIIPDASPRGEGIKLGGKLEQTFTWSEEIDLLEISEE